MVWWIFGKEKGQEGNLEKRKPVKEYYWRVSDPEIAQLEDGINNILSRIKHRIDAGEYKLVVGCDASGRIPTLIMEEVIKELYRQKGLGSLKTRFYAGAYSYVDKERNEKVSKILDSIAGVLKENPGRVLVVTEAILTGRSLVPILQVLKHLHAPFDVATTSSESNISDSAKQRNYLSPLFEYMDPDSIITGEADYGGITHNSKISGVVKDYKDAFSRSYKKEEYEGDPAAQRRVQQGINNSRIDVDAVVHNLLIDYKKL